MDARPAADGWWSLLWGGESELGILRPGFAPLGWTPSTEEIARLTRPGEEQPFGSTLLARDCLQFCTRCNGFKPPRAHHCSTCGRCVLWMDHHCPWTNTCIGHQNLKSFVQFVHYATLACVHSFYVQCEAVVRIAMLLYQRKLGTFWRFLGHERTIFALLSWIADLVIIILVGSLAWDMHSTVSQNTTMVEEMIIEKAEVTRSICGEQPFVFPYDLGSDRNWCLVMGSRFWRWVLPLLEPSDGIWPALKEGSGPFDLSTEQLAQKALKLSKSVVIPVSTSYSGKWGCCSAFVCRCYYWAHMSYHFGCGTACSGPCCDELHLSVQAGDSIVVSHREENWLMGRVLASESEGPDGPEGWVPSNCVDAKAAWKFEVPFQRQLQGTWITAAGPATVAGPVAFLPARQVPYVLRKDRTRTVLLGRHLEECDGLTARWSGGYVWHRPQQTASGAGKISELEREDVSAVPQTVEAKKDL